MATITALELDDADLQFLEEEASRTGGTVSDAVRALLCLAREQRYAEMTAALEASFAPLDVPDDGVYDGSVNHDRYS